LYAYDGFDRKITANMGGTVTTYTYRPDGLRHSKTVNGITSQR
jgi:YD repeat-containing protein